MATALDRILDRYRCVIRVADLRDRGDADLLTLFARDREEAAFEVLVRRYGPMVLGVCLRVLRHRQDAEDAFQATFLLLAQRARASGLRSPDALANWLYGVAHRTALEARAAAARRRDKERRPRPTAEATPDPARDEALAILDEELAALPEAYRAAVVSCDLAGEARAEVAARLRCPEGTVASRLARGRALLAGRLARRGVALSVGGVSGVLAGRAAAAVPPSLSKSTVRVAALISAGQGAASVAPAAVLTLMKGASQVTAFTSRRWVLVVVAGVGLAAGWVLSSGGVRPPAANAAPAPKGEPKVEPRLAAIDGIVGKKKVEPAPALIVPGVEAADKLLGGSGLTDFLNPGESIDKGMWKEQVTGGIEAGRDHLRVRFTKPRQVEVTLNGKKAKVAVSEVVFFDPAVGGPVCLWARDGETYYFANQLAGHEDLVKWLARVQEDKKPPTE